MKGMDGGIGRRARQLKTHKPELLRMASIAAFRGAYDGSS